MSTFTDDTQAAWELYVEELAKLPGVLSVSTGRRVRDGNETREPAVVVTVAKKLPPEQLGPSGVCPRELLLPNGKAVRTDVVEDLRTSTHPIKIQQCIGRFLTVARLPPLAPHSWER